MHVVVIGAGYAGLTLSRELERRLPEEADLQVVDETGTHLVQHELHRLIRRPGLADELQFPLSDLLEDAELTRARVDDVDTEERTITFEDGETLSYDVGAICLGADAAFYDLPGLEEHATPLKRIEHASAIRADVEPVLEDGGRIVVGGAGLSGIQVAGELAEMRANADSEANVFLLEQHETVAPGFDPEFQTAVRKQLEKRDVSVWTDAAVTGADDDAVTLADGESMAYDELIWTGGIRGDDAMERERPVVRSDLRLDERTFALGDAVRVVDDHGENVPASARTAMGQARVVATNVETLVEHAMESRPGSFAPPLERYTMGQRRWLVSVGDGAVAQIGRAVVTGRPALALKTTVGAGYVSRVGPIRNALDLVRSELGLADNDLAAVPGFGDVSNDADGDGDIGRRGDDVDGGGDVDRGDAEEEYDALPDSVVEELTDE